MTKKPDMWILNYIDWKYHLPLSFVTDTWHTIGARNPAFGEKNMYSHVKNMHISTNERTISNLFSSFYKSFHVKFSAHIFFTGASVLVRKGNFWESDQCILNFPWSPWPKWWKRPLARRMVLYEYRFKIDKSSLM